MIHFIRMVLGASCINCISLELTLNIKMFVSTIILQSWILAEWVAIKSNKRITYDPVLHDILPLLAQMVVFFKAIFVVV